MDIAAPPLSVPAEPLRTISVSRLLTSLRRGWWLILGAAIAVASVAYVVSARMAPVYVANGMLVLDTQRFAIPELQGAMSESSSDPMPWVRTEAVVLRSPALLDGVVEELGLERLPEFNPTLRDPTLFDMAKQALRQLVAEPLTGGSDQEATVRQMVIGEAARRLTVMQDNRTLTIALDFVASDPDLAARFLNTLMQHRIDDIADARARTNREAGASLARRAEEVRAELEALENQVRDARARNNLVQVRAGSEGQQHLEDLATAATRASLARSQAEADLARVVALRSRGATDELADALNSPTISMLRDREAEALRKGPDMTSRLGSRHPDRRAAEAELAAARRQVALEIERLAAAVETRVRLTRDQEAAAKRQLEDAREVALRAARAQSEIGQLERDADARRQLYQTLLERAEQAASDPRTVEQAPGVRIVTAALPPAAPTAPRPVLSGAVGGLVGLALGGLLAVARGQGTGGFARPQEITEATGQPVIAVVPRSPRRTRRVPLAQQVVAAPAGPQAEALRELRARLRVSFGGPVPRSVLLVPVDGARDSADLAAAFARVAALDGERVMLVEGDLRRPVLAERLGLEGMGRGAEALRRVLEGRESWRDLATADSATPLRLLLARGGAARCHGLLAGARFQGLLGELCEDHTLVVLNGPSPLAASDALALAHAVDAVLPVFGSARGSRLAAIQSVERLGTPSWRRPMGAVFAQTG